MARGRTPGTAAAKQTSGGPYRVGGPASPKRGPRPCALASLRAPKSWGWDPPPPRLPAPRFGARQLSPPGRDKTIRRAAEGRAIRRPVTVVAIADGGTPRSKLLLHDSGIRRCQSILGRQIPLRPGSRLIRRLYGAHLLNQAFPQAC